MLYHQKTFISRIRYNFSIFNQISNSIHSMDIANSQTTRPNSSSSDHTEQYSNPFIPLPTKIYNPIHLLLNYLAQHWTLNIVLAFIVYYVLAVTGLAEILSHDQSAISGQDNIRYSIKGTLIYCLGWIVILTVHEQYGNDYMRLLKADNREGYKRMVILSFKLCIFYVLALQFPANHYANRFLAILTLYIWLSQKYFRTAIHYNYHSITMKKMQFVNNFTMNQATSLVFIASPLTAALLPELPWLPGFITLFPILCRFTQCFIVGTHQQYLNSIKFTLNLIGFGYSVVAMPIHSHYWRIAASFYSFYWDVFRDWKWKIRFYEKKEYRIDLPFIYFILGFLYDLFGRTIWIIIPMTTQQRGIIEMTRRLAWDMLRIEREQVFYFPKPQKNKVKDLFSS